MSNNQLGIMKTHLIILSTLLTVVGCTARVPISCESDEAKTILTKIILDNAKTPASLFDINISKVITHDVVHETGNQSCEASVSVKMNAATKAEWDNATATLENSIKSDEFGFPTTKYLQNVSGVEDLLNVRDNDESTQNMMILLSNTSYAEKLKKYLEQMSAGVEHPHFYFYLANNQKLKQLYSALNTMSNVYPNITQTEFNSKLKYTTKLVKLDGKVVDMIQISDGTAPISKMRDINEVNKIVETLVQ